MKILVLDNYDSFTYNLVHLIRELKCGEITVLRNDKIALDEVDQFDQIVLSPGPGIPEEAGIMPALIARYAATKRILGVCLGHQAIGEAFGATLTNLTEVVHGKGVESRITDRADPLFIGLPETIVTGRYHSWVVSRDKFPDSLLITAEDAHGQIMALRHKSFDVYGVQFHPESVLTPDGKTILSNFFDRTKR